MRLSYFLFLFLIAFAACRGSKYLANNLTPGSIPSDITKPNYVLLVQADKHTRKVEVNNTMKKYYPAPYELVSVEELATNKKYADVNKYRYLVGPRTGSGGSYYFENTNPDGSSSHTGGRTETFSDQIVVDRKENKQLPATNLVSHDYGEGLMLFCKAVKHIQGN